MDPAFDPPEGDAASLQQAITKLKGLAKGLVTDKNGVTSAVQTAVGQWNGPRKRDFERAGAGLELRADEAAIAVGEIADALHSFHSTLTSTTSEVSGYRKQAAKLDDHTGSGGAHGGPQAVDPGAQHSLQHLIGLANDAKDDLARKARTTAHRIDGITSGLVKSPSKLSPADLRRQVRHADGVGSLGTDATMTSKQAWKALQGAIEAVPEKAVSSTGTIDWEKLLGQASTSSTLATAPPAIWSFGRLIKYAHDGKRVSSDLLKLYSETVSRVGLSYDRGESTLEELALVYKKFDGVKKTTMAARAAEGADVKAMVKDGGLTKTLEALKVPGETAAKISRVAGPGLGVLGMAADVDTFIHPGTHAEGYSTGEIWANRGASAVNFASTAAVLSAPLLEEGGTLAMINAGADWIPGVGEVVMVGTGLYLAGDYLYHHWKPFKHVVDGTVHKVENAAKDTWGAAKSAWHAVTPW